jgi:hypothetical protein
VAKEKETARRNRDEVPTDGSDAVGTQEQWKFSSQSCGQRAEIRWRATAHGSAQMPVWGPLLQSLDKFHDTGVQQRVSNLVSYIETLQAK